MDLVRSYIGANVPLNRWILFSSLWLVTQQTSQKVRKKLFNWSEIHLYHSNFLQNPYFKQIRDRPMCLQNLQWMTMLIYAFYKIGVCEKCFWPRFYFVFVGVAFLLPFICFFQFLFGLWAFLNSFSIQFNCGRSSWISSIF